MQSSIAKPYDYEVFGSITEVLTAWARWRKEGHGVDIGFPGESAFRRLMLVEGESNLRAIPISDDLAGMVDSAVGRLMLQSRPVEGDHRWAAVVECYLCGFPDSKIAKMHRISKSAARNSRQAGENFIEGGVLTLAG